MRAELTGLSDIISISKPEVQGFVHGSQHHLLLMCICRMIDHHMIGILPMTIFYHLMGSTQVHTSCGQSVMAYEGVAPNM